MKHLDLFSGIGGFALAAQQVWGDEYNNLFFCDYDQYCQRVLAKRFPGATIYGDIRTVANTEREGLERHQQHDTTKHRENEGVQLGTETCDLLTGGFPCQPFSQAGRRKGTDDNRYLWPEMLRVIQTFKPTWVIAENVRGLLTIQQGMVFEQVCLDLEASGYEVQPLIIPAVAVNAPHRRDRVWFIAHRRSEEPRRLSSSSRKTVPETWQPDWNQNWTEVATEFCSVDDGLSVELDGFELSKSKHRAEQLKAYGNAIVPQVAMEIMKAIKQTMI